MKLKKDRKKVRVKLLDEKGKSKTFTIYDATLKNVEKFFTDSIKNLI